ncbi:MAG: EscU/YscU/HrcU family type III secretion system export apparatus switch protein [Gammaproteobacteria bacterium]|nr:EscU/YscU/HrcU family type III secretion system export apparatus switch protein [Gammaproteobacteria bacterium]
MNENTPAPPDVAVALKWEEGRGAPRVTAKGRGETARRILDLADASGVPLRQDAELTALLCQVDIGAQIPRELYIAVAEVIAFAYLLSERQPGTTAAAGEDGISDPPPA